MVSTLTASLYKEIHENMRLKMKVILLPSFHIPFVKAHITYAEQYEKNSIFQTQSWFR
jgi:hypothetical protein